MPRGYGIGPYPCGKKEAEEIAMSRKTHEISEEKLQEHLEALGQVEPPRPGNFAREQALERALAEFDAVSGETEKSSGPTKGMAAGKRPMSIINRIKGLVPMNARFPVAATLSGLLLLPLGVFLFQNTALTPVVTLPGLAPKPVQQESMEVDEAAGGAATKQESDAPADTSSPSVLAPVVEPSVESAPPAPQPAVPSVVQAPSVVQMRKTAGAPLGGLVAPMQDSYTVSTESGALDATTPSGDRFAAFEESPVKSVRTDPVSTFSIDVDTASYAYVRRALNEGRLPEPDAVRIEEMVNYFSYDYARPDSLESPFLPQIEISPSPWNNATQIMRIGIKGYVPPADERRPVNLVFLVDTSGSMSTPDKLPLLKRALALVVDQMHDTDTISIVAYAGSAGTVLEPTPASDRAAILGALERLESGGSTAGAQGIELAYRLAEQNNVEGSVSRVLLATDGDFNVGLSSDAELKQFIERKREGGTFLSVLGFGTGNLNDSLMQTLAQNGNGTAYYIDSFREARKVLVEEIGATLTTIAKDVK
ncbi:MAG TPA: VWA domain-containing protein, partial [Devosia sp.]|nr:VWA domain-containing protein [Devosia sp.]